MLKVWDLYLLPRGGVYKLSDDQVVKQYPYSLKVEATAQGFRISAHAYGENMEQVITDTGNMISKGLTELERHNLILAVNQRNEAVAPKEISLTEFRKNRTPAK